MKVLISGSRHWTDIETIASVLEKLPVDTQIIHGAAIGVDTIADVISQELGMPKAIQFPVSKEEWEKFGKSAGFLRNKRMLLETQPDLVIVFIDRSQKSNGSQSMIDLAETYGYKCIVVSPNNA